MCLFRTHLNTSDALGTQDVLHSFVPCASFFVFPSLFHFPPAVTDMIKMFGLIMTLRLKIYLTELKKKQTVNYYFLLSRLFFKFFVNTVWLHLLVRYGNNNPCVCNPFFSIILERFCFVCHHNWAGPTLCFMLHASIFVFYSFVCFSAYCSKASKH